MNSKDKAVKFFVEFVIKNNCIPTYLDVDAAGLSRSSVEKTGGIKRLTEGLKQVKPNLVKQLKPKRSTMSTVELIQKVFKEKA